MGDVTTSGERMRVYRFDEPIERSLAPRSQQRRQRSVWKPIIAVVALLAIGAGAVLYLGRPADGQLPAGTQIAGVAVGGKTPDEAIELVRAHGSKVVGLGLVFQAGNKQFTIDPAEILLRPDAARAVALAAGESGFVDRIKGRLGLVEPRNLPLTYTFNTNAYAQATVPVRQALSIDPKSAAVSAAEAGSFVVAPAVAGQRADVDAMRSAVRHLEESGPIIEVPTIAVAPSISTAVAQSAADQATTFVGTTHAVNLQGASKTLPQDVISRSVEFLQQASSIRFAIKRPVLRAYFSKVFGTVETPPRDAIFTVNPDNEVRIIGGRNGRGVDVDTLAKTWEGDPGQHITPITVGVREPDMTNERARTLGVKEVVSAYFTPYTGGARVTNIKRGAEIMDQFLIPAGATFSLNDSLGERTLQRGFVAAPMIGEGNVLKDSVGGGVSQVATTIFNAAFFAGLKLIAHTPHSFWIPRYPKGREATVSWGGPELVFKNNWDAPIIIVTRTGVEGITVWFLSDKLGRRIEAIEDPPYAPKKAKMIRVRDNALAPGEMSMTQHVGEDGFSIRYGRKIFKNDKLISTEYWKWTYAPENGIVSMGPRVPGGGGAPAVDPAEGAATDPSTSTDATTAAG